tara:strand:- start:6476 stop:7918 length:1443 start_codon:yes stop_codon:yes gene_type:complete
MSEKVPITVAYGDGIGPEIMEATLNILEAAGADLAPEKIEIGESVYLRGVSSGIEDEAWDSLRRTRVFLKAPITTPQGGGFKSLNVTTRKVLGLYANVRPCVAYDPFISTKHPSMDVVIVRENEEDTYAGIEHMHADGVAQTLKLITRSGSERICRHAFEFAVTHGRDKVTCFTKDNIMKLTDGLFHRVFDEVAADYPDIENEHWIVDIGAAKLADTPELFDVVVLPNLYGDILSDVAAQIAGSVGLAGSANIGDGYAMFEAIHGSAPRRAGQNLANPSGLLHGAVMMMVYVKQVDIASSIHNAWLRTIEDGIHTYDVYTEKHSTKKVGTKEFSEAVIDRLGMMPTHFDSAQYAERPSHKRSTVILRDEFVNKALVGVDVFIDWTGGGPDDLAGLLQPLQGSQLKLEIIDNRGVKVWPDGLPETYTTRHWRCRFGGHKPINHEDIVGLLNRMGDSGFDFVKTENLYTYDGERGFSLPQGG